MESLQELYKIGQGPSSSHTMGPRRAATRFGAEHPDATSFRVTLYGSLAATGRGHLTDLALQAGFAPRSVEIAWQPNETLPLHPNGMDLVAVDAAGNSLAKWRAYSVGGGTIRDDATFHQAPNPVYRLSTMREILAAISEGGSSFWEFVEEAEGPAIWDYLSTIWRAMQATIARGLAQEGVLPGSLKLQRKSSSHFIKSQHEAGLMKKTNEIFAYALACSEENAAGGMVVTAPTCGSCGILPAVLYCLQQEFHLPETRMLHALATAGVVGNLAKTNGSISGAEVGCQGEVGVACSMAAGAATYLLGGSPRQVEYAAEMALEHHLGLTCDPIAGLVQIPCIERNAMGAVRGLDCAAFALLSDGVHKISYDQVVQVMLATGRDLKCKYRETSLGGLAQGG